MALARLELTIWAGWPGTHRATTTSFIFILEAESHSVAQGDPELLVTLLPLPPKRRDCNHTRLNLDKTCISIPPSSHWASQCRLSNGRQMLAGLPGSALWGLQPWNWGPVLKRHEELSHLELLRLGRGSGSISL